MYEYIIVWKITIGNFLKIKSMRNSISLIIIQLNCGNLSLINAECKHYSHKYLHNYNNNSTERFQESAVIPFLEV